MLGLLTLGSSYRPRLPVQLEKDSGFMRRSSPITAAGPYRNFTGFPFMARRGQHSDAKPAQVCLIKESVHLVKRTIAGDMAAMA